MAFITLNSTTVSGFLEADFDQIKGLLQSATYDLNTGSITTSGTVDGRDIATDGATLDTLDGFVDQSVISGATPTFTGTNFSGTAASLVVGSTTGVEAGADVTDETNVVAALDGASLTATTIATSDKVIFQDISDTDNIKTATAQSIADLATDSRIFSQTVALSDETTALTTGTAKLTFRVPAAVTLTDVRASVTTAPTGSVLTVDINEGGVSILSTLITIDAGEKTSTTAATPPVISDSALADDAEITVDIDTVGSTVAGTGLKVTLIGTYN